ncbi:MAG: hypothetical protein QOC99_2702 [Acidobacteriota bacterium]|nr:hypothetical protein [Acidobacteriota bacterium]
MEAYVHIFRQVLPLAIVKALLDDSASFDADDHPEGQFSNHQSQAFACSCRLCTPEVLRTYVDSKEPCTASLSKALNVVQGLLWSVPETHCINRLTKDARHLHHVDGEESWWKLIIILKRARSGGMLSIAPRCEPCLCLTDGRCVPFQPIEIDLRPGDAYGIWSGRVCHGVSEVGTGMRATWALRYASEPEVIHELMESGRCYRVEAARTQPKFEPG